MLSIDKCSRGHEKGYVSSLQNGYKTHRLNEEQKRCKLSRNDRMNDFEFPISNTV